MFNCVFVTFLCGILGQVWYLIVQITFLLCVIFKFVIGVKVIPGEMVALSHQLLVCSMMIDMPQIKHKGVLAIRRIFSLVDMITKPKF